MVDGLCQNNVQAENWMKSMSLKSENFTLFLKPPSLLPHSLITFLFSLWCWPFQKPVLCSDVKAKRQMTMYKWKTDIWLATNQIEAYAPDGNTAVPGNLLVHPNSSINNTCLQVLLDMGQLIMGFELRSCDVALVIIARLWLAGVEQMWQVQTWVWFEIEFKKYLNLCDWFCTILILCTN